MRFHNPTFYLLHDLKTNAGRIINLHNWAHTCQVVIYNNINKNKGNTAVLEHSFGMLFKLAEIQITFLEPQDVKCNSHVKHIISIEYTKKKWEGNQHILLPRKTKKEAVMKEITGEKHSTT